MSVVAFLLVASLMAATALATTTSEMPGHEGHHHKHLAPTLPGPCPEYEGFNIDVTKVVGEWFVIQCGNDGFDMKGERGRCVKLTVGATPEGAMTGSVTLIHGNKTMTHSSTDTPVKGKPGTFTVSTSESHNKTSILTILDTDYSNYASSVICLEHGDNHGLFTEIISRQKNLDNALLEKAKKSLTDAKITAELRPVDQSC